MVFCGKESEEGFACLKKGIGVGIMLAKQRKAPIKKKITVKKKKAAPVTQKIKILQRSGKKYKKKKDKK